MTAMTTTSNDPQFIFKGAANNLKQQLEADGFWPGHAKTLGYLAQALGVKNYRTLKALLARAVASTPTWPEGLPRLAAGQRFTVYLGGMPTSEYGNAPSAARFTLDQQFLELLVQRQALVVDNKLANTAEPYGIEWANEQEYGVELEELWVTSTAFYWHAYDANDVAIETRTVYVAQLGQAIADAIAAGRAELFLNIEQNAALAAFDVYPEENETDCAVALRNAFEVTADDVALVLRKHSLRVVNTEGLSFDAYAELLYSQMEDEDFMRCARAALDAGVDLDAQTEAAQSKLYSILYDFGVFK